MVVDIDRNHNERLVEPRIENPLNFGLRFDDIRTRLPITRKVWQTIHSLELSSILIRVKLRLWKKKRRNHKDMNNLQSEICLK